MKKLFTVLFALMIYIIPDISKAQMDAQYSQYMYNHLSINPAYSSLGSLGLVCATVLYRDQWAGYKGWEFGESGPVTQAMTIHSSIPGKYFHGVGIDVINDAIGFISTQGFKLSASHKFEQVGQGDLSIGLGAGMYQKSVNGEWVCPDGGSCTDDPLVPDEDVTEFVPDFSFGIFYKTQLFYVGLSALHLHEPAFQEWGSIKNIIHRTYYLTGGYNYILNQNIDIRPTVLFKTDGVKLQMDLTANVFLNNRIWGGIGYRFEDAIYLMAGMEVIQNVFVGYAYDITTSEMRKFSSGSHEIMARYCFKIPVRERDFPPIKIRTPRHL